MDEKMIFAKIFQNEDAVLPKKSLSCPLQIAAVEFQRPSVFARIQKTTSGERDQLDALNSFVAFLELSRARL